MTSTTKPIQPTSTTAFYLQAVISFGLALVAVALGIAYLPADAWVRGFLAVGMLYLVTSTFMLAKVVRDRQELSTVSTRVDQARLDKLLAQHDPFKVDA
ncbi:YiaA/YiaB family inner membrane protein [Nonomuraea sp. NPDC050663]|uniref:YiaA/YiaB family inner membrane protein n=1 Tax=Nonomuraea sp. NPDC050663 TaxID=3364370 RepID=UPI0037A51E16